MKKLLLFTIALVLMLFAPVQAANVNTVKTAIVTRSIEMGVDPAIMLSIAKAESGYRHETKSPRGAVGVFQLMPSTARRIGFNPYYLDDNIKAGITYYKSMYKMFGSVELALAAYNAGPGNVKKYNAVPPFSETKRYVARIMTEYKQMKAHPDPVIIAVKKEQEAAAAAKLAATAAQNGQQPKKTPATTTATTTVATTQTTVQSKTAVVAQATTETVATTSKPAVQKSAPLPMHSIEQTRNLTAGILKGLPLEAEVKSQSVAM